MAGIEPAIRCCGFYPTIARSLNTFLVKRGRRSIHSCHVLTTLRWHGGIAAGTPGDSPLN